MQTKEYFTTSEAAQVLDISRIAVFKHIQKKKLLALKSGRNFLIPKGALVEMLLKKQLAHELSSMIGDFQSIIGVYSDLLCEQTADSLLL